MEKEHRRSHAVTFVKMSLSFATPQAHVSRILIMHYHLVVHLKGPGAQMMTERS